MKIFAILVAAAMAGLLVACGGQGIGHQFDKLAAYRAVINHDWETVEQYLNSGVDPNSTDGQGQTAIMEAAAVGATDAVQMLLDGGANPNAANNKGWTSLMGSAVQGRTEVVKLLLAEGANVNAAAKDGTTALIFAARTGQFDVIKVLLDAGANPNAATNNGETALIGASGSGHSKVAKILLAAEANPGAITNNGWTALGLAANNGHAEVAKTLLDAGANPDTANEHGWTALNIAAHYGQATVAKALLDCGASPDKRNNEGKNAWHWANRQPIMHAIFYKHLAEVKAGKIIKSCPHEKIAAAPPPPKGENIAEKVFENAWRSVVVVKSGGRQGSGVIVRPNAVATNCHVIDGGDIVVHKTGDRRALTDSAFAASVRRRDTERDFCLLDVAGLWGIPAGIRAYGSLKVGEDVYALGAPQGLDLSLSAGVISQLRQGRAVRYIQTDAAISPGSSGGGLFDSNANLIGILTAKIASENVEGIGFAIPADLATTP